MRWKLLKRRFSVSAPRMIVRNHLPWPLRWVALAVMFGFSAALALWAFEFGKEIAGVDRGLKTELLQLRTQNAQLQIERDLAVSISNTAESRWKTDRASYDSLVQQLKDAQAEVLALKADLGFFERLMPLQDESQQVAVRGLQLDPHGAGRMRFQLLLMHPGKSRSDFQGRFEITLQGSLDGRAWTWNPVLATNDFILKRYLRLEGLIEYPAEASVKVVSVKVLDAQGVGKATHSTKL